MKVKMKAKYGQVGKHYTSFETAKSAFKKLGYEVTDLGDGILEYEMKVEENDPLMPQLKEFIDQPNIIPKTMEVEDV